MIFRELSIRGALVIDPEHHEDDRGFFDRTYGREEFLSRGIHFDVEQANVSFNRRRGTLRGMHYQAAPYAESKLLSCIQGALYEVILDLRPQSSTYGLWTAVELSLANGRALFVPEGCAHGFQTLLDETVVAYQMSAGYRPDRALGIRWDDPAFDLSWPLPDPIISARDRGFADYLGNGQGDADPRVAGLADHRHRSAVL